MQSRTFVALMTIVAIVGLVPISGAAPGPFGGVVGIVHAQTRAAGEWSPPRTPEGRPDLQGGWANNSATPLERPEQLGGKATLTDEELADLRAKITAFRDREQAGDLLGDRLVQQALGNPEFQDFDVITGNYNSFWLVDRELDNRTSLISDPPDGRIPALTADAQRREGERRAYARAHPADGPEDRTLGDRCLHFDAPRISAGYNSYFQILQTPEYVAILQEMGHQARIIPLDRRPHIAENLRLWNGDSRGWWEGDTLVVETTNYSPQSRFQGATENLRLVERYTRISADTIAHELTLDDPTTWTRPWTVVLHLKKSTRVRNYSDVSTRGELVEPRAQRLPFDRLVLSATHPSTGSGCAD
jgi:hypothetical protein